MLTNYIITAIRSLLRNKIASAISIGGLALGMACALLIFLFIQFELSFDRFHTKRDRIFLVMEHGTRLTVDQAEADTSSTVHELALKLRSEFPEVRNVVRLSPQTATVRYKDLL